VVIVEQFKLPVTVDTAVIVEPTSVEKFILRDTVIVEQYTLLVIVDAAAYNVEHVTTSVDIGGKENDDTTNVEQLILLVAVTTEVSVEPIKVEQFTWRDTVDNVFKVDVMMVEQFALLVIVDAEVNVEVVSEDKEVNVLVHAATPEELM